MQQLGAAAPKYGTRDLPAARSPAANVRKFQAQECTFHLGKDAVVDPKHSKKPHIKSVWLVGCCPISENYFDDTGSCASVYALAPDAMMSREDVELYKQPTYTFASVH